MRSPARQAWLGLLIAVLSSAAVLGSAILALVESGQYLSLSLSPTPTLIYLELPPTGYLPGEITLTAQAARPSSTPTSTSTNPSPSACIPPGWIAILVQAGDTLESLAGEYGTTVENLRIGNCLPAGDVIPGTLLYIPPTPPSATPAPSASNTPTTLPTICQPQSGWVQYLIRSGDTLASIGRAVSASVTELQAANCMGSSITIYAGQYLWVPRLPVFTPTPTATPYTVPTATQDLPQPTFFTPTPTPSFTPTATSTAMPAATSAATSTSIPHTSTSTATEVPPPPEPPTSTATATIGVASPPE